MVDVVLHLVGVGDVVGRQDRAGAVGAAAQQIVAGDAVVIGDPDDEVQAALPDALFVVGQQRLGDVQVLGGLLLGDAALGAQELDDTVEFHECPPGPPAAPPGRRKSPFFPLYNNTLIIHNGKRLVKEKIDEILPDFSSFLSKDLPCHQIYDKLEQNSCYFVFCARKKFLGF